MLRIFYDVFTADSTSPFQVAAAKAGSGQRFNGPKPLPSCVRAVQPLFMSPFQLGRSGMVASDPGSGLPASVAISLRSADVIGKALPAFLPVAPARQAPPRGAPLPKPTPKPASFYAIYPPACEPPPASDILASSCPAKAVSALSMKPQVDLLAASKRDWQPPALGLMPASCPVDKFTRSAPPLCSAYFSSFAQFFSLLVVCFSGLQGSLHEVEFQARLLCKVADTTAASYLRSAMLFLQTVEDLGGSVLSLSDALAADAIFILHRAGEGCLGHPSNVLKAIRWVTKTLDPDPWPNVWSSLFGIFAGSGASERKESVPLPCAFLAWLEHSILGGNLGESFICFAGGASLLYSLRFGDSSM